MAVVNIAAFHCMERALHPAASLSEVEHAVVASERGRCQLLERVDDKLASLGNRVELRNGHVLAIQ